MRRILALLTLCVFLWQSTAASYASETLRPNHADSEIVRAGLEQNLRSIAAGLEGVVIGLEQKWQDQAGISLGQFIPITNEAGDPVGRVVMPDFNQLRLVEAWNPLIHDPDRFPKWQEQPGPFDEKRRAQLLQAGQVFDAWIKQMQQPPADLSNAPLAGLFSAQQNNFNTPWQPLIYGGRVIRQEYANLDPKYSLDADSLSERGFDNAFWFLVLGPGSPRVTALSFKGNELDREGIDVVIEKGRPVSFRTQKASIDHAIPGTPLVFHGQDVSDQIRWFWDEQKSQHRELRPNEVVWNPVTTRAAFSAIGVQHNGRVALVAVTEELTVRGFTQLLIRLGFREAVLLGGSGDVHQWIDGQDLVLRAKGRVGSLRPGENRTLNVVLALYAQPPAAGLEAKRFPKPVLDETHPFRSRMDQEEVTYSNRHLIQEEWLSNEVLPVLVERNRATQEITLAVLGASTGEEIARFWHWIVRWLEKQDYAGWKVKVLAVEVNPALIEEAKARLSGEEGHPLAYAVWKSDRERSPNIEKDVQAFSNEIAATVERDADLIEQAVEWIPGSMTDSHILERIVAADPDIAISNVASSYLSSSERRTLWGTLTSRTSAWIGTTDEFLRTAAKPPRGFEERLVEAGQQPLLEPASPIALPYYFSAPAAGLEQERSDSMPPTEFAGGLRISAASYSVKGGPRAVNMDRAGMSKRGFGRPGDAPVGFSAVVADGVGWNPGSEGASRYAVAQILRFMSDSRRRTFMGEPAQILLEDQRKEVQIAAAEEIHERMELAFERAHSHLRRRPGPWILTTAAHLVVIGNRAFVASVADTRVYRLQGGNLRLISTEDDRVVVGGKTRIAQALGSPGDIQVHLYESDVQPGDVFGIFTDGVYGRVSEMALRAAMGARPNVSPLDQAKTLVNLANPAQGDDATALIIRIEAAPAAAGLEQVAVSPPVTLSSSKGDLHRASTSSTRTVALIRKETAIDQKAGYIFRPHEAGMAILLKQFQDPDSNPAVFYALVRSPEQARALVQAGVDPGRIVALARDRADSLEYTDDPSIRLPGDNVLIGFSEQGAVDLLSRWLQELYQAQPTLLSGDLANTAQALLAQIVDWLDAQGWKAVRPLTLPEAEAILEVNGMA